MKKILGLFISFIIFLQAGDSDLSYGTDSVIMWIIMFILVLVIIVVLYRSSKQISNIKKMHQDTIDKQQEMEKSQAIILTSMSENIHDMAVEALSKDVEEKKTEKNVLENSNNGELVASMDVSNPLLDVTSDLIDFLRLKSKRVEIVIEEFNLNNVLNEISGTLASRFAGNNVEVIFNIDNEVPRYIKGDSLHFGQIITNLLENRLSLLSNEELKLEISMANNLEDKFELQFEIIDNGSGMSQSDMDKLFIPYFDDANSKYVGLGLFVARELVNMMDGELNLHSTLGQGTSFVLNLTFDAVDPTNKRKYRLPYKVLTDKKVFIVDDNYNSALAVKKMFAYFRHDVTVLTKEKYLSSIVKFDEYDIIVLNESLISTKLLNHIQDIKDKKALKVITLTSLMNPNNNIVINDTVDQRMFKPLNQERVFEMIINIYSEKSAQISDNILNKVKSKKLKIHKSDIHEAQNITPSSFSSFSGNRLLIVEDNIINQKVLVNILSKSGMDISVANNGVEGVKIVEESKKEGNNKIDLILMDINMPVMDGFSATKEIRNMSEFDDLPIVSFTALVLDSEIEKMFNSGMNAFLSKPLNIGKLYTAMSIFIFDKPNKVFKDKSKDNLNLKIPSLDIGAGIINSNGSEVLYSEILSEFIMAYGDSDKIFENLVEEHLYEQLKVLCLDMKGLTGTIGAKDMNNKISKIQNIILNKNYELLPSYVAKYRRELKKLVLSIELYLER